LKFSIRSDLAGIDWGAVKTDLAMDDFDNGRTPQELSRSFENSHAVALAWSGDRVIGTGRLLADGVCNAYLVDVWTKGEHRRNGIASAMVRRLLDSVPGHHVILQTDHHESFYRSLGFTPRSGAMEVVVGTWLDPDRI
jgi:ribosomal protein S18 acetylase RimI-like enzyme